MPSNDHPPVKAALFDFGGTLFSYASTVPARRRRAHDPVGAWPIHEMTTIVSALSVTPSEFTSPPQKGAVSFTTRATRCM